MSLALTGNTVITGTILEPDGTIPAVAGQEVTAYDKLGEVIARTISVAGGMYVLVIP
ncbi:MAG: hypothetical protein ACI8QS_002692 [Planctomycetota bacterium]|jgi:hypothetical protein